MATVLTEADLEGFRRDHLSPEAILRQVDHHRQVLLRLPVGVGKSYSAHGFVLDDAVRARFDLIIYGAPRLELLGDLASKLEQAGVRHRTLLGRPTTRCGPLDEEWKRYEQAACGALGRRKLCLGRCLHVKDCKWPFQLNGLEDAQVVLTSEQRLGHHRDLARLLTEITGAERVLIVLDEGELAGMPFEVVITHAELQGFQDAVESVEAASPEAEAQKQSLLDACRLVAEAILRETTTGLRIGECDPRWEEEAVQEAGFESGHDFRFLGFDLELLRGSDPRERYVEYDRLRFIARPKLDGPLLVLSANLDDEYFAHRLGLEAIASPFKGHRFVHTDSRFINIQSGAGTAYNFHRSHESVLRHFAAFIAWNALHGTSTLLVSKLRYVETCREVLEGSLRELGLEVRIVPQDRWDELPAEPDPHLVPILHYGMVGTNRFETYESALCLNGYYTKRSIIERALQEADPLRSRVPLELETVAGRTRRVIPKVWTEKSSELTRLGAVYLRKLEVDPVIQALGRVRPMTKPRTIVAFAQHNLDEELPGVESVKTLKAARHSLGVPSFNELKALREALVIQRLLDEGATVMSAARELGISRETAHGRLKVLRSGRFLNSFLIALSCTLSGAPAGSESRSEEVR